MLGDDKSIDSWEFWHYYKRVDLSSIVKLWYPRIPWVLLSCVSYAHFFLCVFNYRVPTLPFIYSPSFKSIVFWYDYFDNLIYCQSMSTHSDIFPFTIYPKVWWLKVLINHHNILWIKWHLLFSIPMKLNDRI